MRPAGSLSCAPAVVVAAALLLGATWPAGAAEVPRVSWRTLQTEHFRVHFYEQERRLAARAAVIAERAHGLLTRMLNWTPGGRIDIVLSDRTDWANGLARIVPRNLISLFGTPPDSLSTLNDFDDWLTLLVVHELAHIVHLDVTLGISRLINFVLGKQVAPSSAQPNWVAEGMAVLMESTLSTAGRLRSSLYDMQLRMATLGGRLHGLDAVSAGPLAFPYGEAPYLYGGAFMRYLRDRFGQDKLIELVHRYARRTIPFALNRNARETTGETIVDLWREWTESLHRRYLLQRETVERAGVTAARRLTREGESSGGPRWFPDGRGVLYAMQQSYWHPAFVLLEPATGARRTVREVWGGGSATPTPDGQALIFERSAMEPLRWRIEGESFVDWSDLYRIDLADGRVSRLTRTARAHTPDVSPDGTRIACTVTVTGAARLAVLPAAGGEPQVLAAAHPDEVAYTPAWSPDGSRLVYSLWKPGGYRDIHIRDLRDGSDRALTLDRAMDLDPRFTADGRHVVFSSDRTGIYNLFGYELETGRLLQITNVLGGAFQPAPSPDGRTLVFTGYSADGFDIYTMPLDLASWRPAAPYVSDRVAEDPALQVLPARDPAPERLRELGASETPYQPWRHLVPRRWGFDFMTSSGLGLGPDIGLSASAADPVGDHTLDATVRLPTSGDVSARAEWTYLRLWPSFSLGGSRAATEARDLVIDGKAQIVRRHTWNGFVTASFPILRQPEFSSDLWAAYDRAYVERTGGLPAADPTGGIMIAPSSGSDAWAAIGWRYSSQRAWNHSVSVQRGRRLGFDVTLFDPSLGSRSRGTQLGWRWTEFFTPPWASLQALGVSYHGGISVGDPAAVFVLGGFEQQDVLRAFFLNRRQCCRFFRGYPAGSLVGTQYHLGSVEYRAPLLWIERGFGTFPVYLRRLHGALFSDVGTVSMGAPGRSDLRWGVGGELRLDLKLGYYYESLLQLGVARGLMHGGATDVYLVTAFPF